MTFLFTDIEGSTRLWQERPTTMPAALARHDAIVRSAIESQRGVVFSTAGDGFGAAFWTPSEAVAASTQAQDALAAEDWNDVTIRVRMGLHTGTSSERGGDYFGPTLNRAARIMSVGHGGQVLLSDVTAKLLGAVGGAEVVDLVDLGEHLLKDIAGVERVWQIGSKGFRPLRSVDGHSSGNRPAPAELLVGRVKELAEVMSLVTEHRVVTLTGAGGVGKTTLAVNAIDAVSDKFPDGVWWVDLASIVATGDAAALVANVLRVQDQLGSGFAVAVASALVDQRLLLVLDNCEHVLESVRDLVVRVATQCRGVSVLCTSRTRLGVVGERDLVVRPLAVEGNGSAAFELLVERIGRTVTAMDDSERSALNDICRRLDGLPLALELAAARCRVMTPTAVAARLDERLRLPAGRGSPLGARATLEGTVRWSYDLLSSDEQAVLARLAMFAGTFSLEAAESVAGGEGMDAYDVDDALAILVEQSLVDRDGARYRLLETTRAFAHERLSELGAVASVEAAHVAWVLDFVRATRVGLRGPEEARFVSILDADWANVRAAFHRSLEWEDPTASNELVTLLFIESAFRRVEGLDWIDRAHRRNGAVPNRHQHELIGAAGWAAWARGHGSRALELGRRAVELDSAPGTAIDRVPQWALGAGMLFTGHAAEACTVIAPVLGTVEQDPFLDVVWHYLFTLASTMADRQATDAAEHSERIAAVVGSPMAESIAAWTRSLALLASDPPRAAAALRESADLAGSVGAVGLQQAALSALVRLQTQVGVPPAEILEEAIPLARSLARSGLMTFAWPILLPIAQALLARGHQVAAALCLHTFFLSPVVFVSVSLPSQYFIDTFTQELGEEEMARLKQQATYLTFGDVIRLAEESLTGQTTA